MLMYSVVWISATYQNNLLNCSEFENIALTIYNGTSLIWSPTGLAKSYLNGEVTRGLTSFLCIVEYNLGPSKGDRNSEVTLLVTW